MTETKDVSTASAGTATLPGFGTAKVGLAPVLPPGALVSRGIEQTLRQLADRHNRAHGEDRRKRADLRALRVAYRRGASGKRPEGRTRRQAGLARAQAHLAALAGKELPAEYTDDRVLLPGEEKRLAVLALEGGVAEPGSQAGPAAAGTETESKEFDETKHPRDHGRFAHVEGALTALDNARGDVLRTANERRDLGEDSPAHDRAAGHLASAMGHLRAGRLDDASTEIGNARGALRDATETAETSIRRVDGYNAGINQAAGHIAAARAQDLSAAAHEATGSAHAGTVTDPALHEAARTAHLAAADAHKAAGDEHAALAHLSLADHHRDMATLSKGQEHPTHYAVGSRVKLPDGSHGDVLGHGANGVAVRGDAGELTVHEPTALTPGSGNTLRGQVAAHEAQPGDFVWDHTVTGGGYRVREVTAAGEHVQHAYDDPVLGTLYQHHHRDKPLRIVRGADAARLDRD